MTYLEIEAFLTIIKCGSITKVAQELFVTQPALSRRIYSLENELGYPLLIRNKGVRSIQLTDSGREFIKVAKKWKLLWQESNSIGNITSKKTFNISSVDSWSTYLFPPVYQNFLISSPNVSLSVRMLHSLESYANVGEGLIDLAFISDDMFSKYVETIPAFREAMCFVSSNNASYPEIIDPSTLDPSKEIRLPWNPEYDTWHEYWFGANPQHYVFLDKMSLLEHFLFLEDSWAIVPQSVAHVLAKSLSIKMHDMKDAPPDRICYYLIGENRKITETNMFLTTLNDHIKNLDGITSLL